MTQITQSLTLLDRGETYRTPSLDLPASVTGTTIGDLLPWFISITVKHSTLQGRVSGADLRLKLDVNNTFVKTAPFLSDEFAKNNYLIEWKATQGNNTSKIFVFQISNVTTDIDKFNGMIINISLNEQWVRLKESFTSIDHYYLSPYKSFINRLNDANTHQGVNGVNFNSASVDLPDSEYLKQNYIPQAPTPILELMQDVLDILADPQVSGGVFLDFYMDFDPWIVSGNQFTRNLEVIAEEFGKQSTGITFDPQSLDTINAMPLSEQTNITDNNQYKNHVILRGGAQAGSLPMEHCKFGSDFLHAAGTKGLFSGRPEWSSSHGQYDVGDQVKVTASGSYNGKTITVLRFFECNVQHTASTGINPTTNITYWEEDFVSIPKWNKYGRYFKDDVVYDDYQGQVKFFICVSNDLNQDIDNPRNDSTERPHQNNYNWASISGSCPNRSLTNFAGFKSPSPWTSDLRVWKANLAGNGDNYAWIPNDNAPSSPNYNTRSPKNYAGYACDWNVTRDTYLDNVDYTDYYKSVNVKAVETKCWSQSAIPNEKLYNGYRVLVAETATGIDFASNRNKIAEYVIDPLTYQGSWKFSDYPNTDDTINVLDTARFFKFNGSSWTDAWKADPLNVGVFITWWDRPTPFHLVGNVLSTRGATGIPASAIEYRFRWSQTIDLLKALGLPITFNETNNNSNGVWINCWYPFPNTSIVTPFNTNGDIGYYYGGSALTNTTKNCLLDTNNSTLNHKGIQCGWNAGIDSEDLGKITGVSFKIKVGFYNDEYHPYGKFINPVVGVANMPMVFWACDMFDRIWYYKFNVRANDQWELITIPFGQFAPKSMFKARWDELPKFLGYNITATDFTIRDKDYTGVDFAWKYVKGWGIFSMSMYNEKWGFYDGGWKDILGRFLTTVKDEVTNVINFFGNVTGQEKINCSSIALDEFRFVKELIVNSDYTAVSNPRTAMISGLGETDYRNAKKQAIAKRKRLSFFPQTWHVRTLGDVRMRVGRTFIVKGDQVPDGEVEMVCAEVTHVINHEGYMMEVVGQRKFTTTG